MFKRETKFNETSVGEINTLTWYNQNINYRNIFQNS